MTGSAGRTEWARVRKEHFSAGVNRTSLAKIESAAFVLVLDDYQYDYEKVLKKSSQLKKKLRTFFFTLALYFLPQDNPSKLNEYCRLMMHGRGNDRWFEKSFCLIVGTNGRIGLNVEHSW